MADYDRRTALVVVDVQNDFADPAGGLYVSGGETILERLNDEIAKAARDGAGVLYTQDWHPPSTPHFAKDGGIWPVHCVQETWGAALHPALDVRGPVVRKGSGGEDGYSGFTMRDPQTAAETPTELDQLLRECDARRLVVAGLATDYCVKETALDARRLGYEVELLRDAIRPVDLQPGDGDRALEEMRAAGVRVDD